MLIFLLFFGFSICLKSIFNDETVRFLLPENHEGINISIDYLDLLIHPNKLPQYIDKTELIEDIKFLESQIPTREEDYLSELLRFGDSIKAASLPFTLISFKRAISSHMIISWTILSESNKVCLQELLWKLDIQLQKVFKLPTELPPIDLYDLWEYGRLNMSYVKIEPQDIFTSVGTLEGNCDLKPSSTTSDEEVFKPYIFPLILKFIKPTLYKWSNSSQRGVSNQCKKAKYLKFLEVYEKLSKNFAELVSSVAEVSTLGGWTKVARKSIEDKSLILPELPGLDLAAIALLGKFPVCKEISSDFQMVGAFFRHFRIIQKHLEVYERRKKCCIVPKILDEFIIRILSECVKFVDESCLFMIEAKHLDENFGGRLYKYLRLKLVKVRELPSSDNTKKKIKASSFSNLSFDYPGMTKVLTPFRVALEYHLFDLMFAYFVFPKKPAIDLLPNLLKRTISKVNRILEFYCPDPEYQKPVRDQFKFFLYTLHVFGRPLSPTLFGNRRDKWALYYAIIENLTDPDLVKEMTLALKHEISISDETFEDIQVLYSSLDFLNDFFH